ncbi:MAG TPA: alpha-L-rhamnosidase C-terminal domain-containing protein, partial [Acidimicrobiales bacterium]
LCPVLTEHGYADVAHRLLLNETFPSWGYSIRHGATTIWERWDGWTEEHGFQTALMNSFNHYSLGSVAQWLYEYVAGIRPAKPGYEHVVISPTPGRLEHAAATFESVRGPIRSAWRQNGDGFQLDVEIPATVTATVILPDGERCEIGSGTYEFALSRSSTA